MGWPKSLRWRYSLRALFVFITLFMIWGGYHANRGWRQRAAEEILHRHGGVLGYDRDPYPKISRATAEYRRFIHALWGERYISTVMLESQLEPDVVNALMMLPQCPSLRLSPPGIPIEEINQMQRTGVPSSRVKLASGALRRVLDEHQLWNITLCQWESQDDDWRGIANEKSLRSIELIGTQLNEERFRELATLPCLRNLRVECCQVTGERLLSEPGSTTLEDVWCQHVPLETEFAKFLARCPNLKSLRLYGNSFDGEFIAALGPHPSLRQIEFAGPVSDASVSVLAQMPSLESVSFAQGALSDEARARLKRANPELFIYPPDDP